MASWTRREMLGGLGLASAHAVWWALGCGGAAKPAVRAPAVFAGEVRTWLRDAVAVLQGAGLVEPRALAVTRRRTTAAVDVLGKGVARAGAAGVVLTARDRDGMHREHVTSELTAAGVAAAAREFAGKTARAAAPAFGEPQTWHASGEPPDDAQLLARTVALAARGEAASSRIVYQAATIEIDDAQTWSVAAGRDLEQRLVRVRRAALRVAWNGTRPVVGEVERAWTGGVDDRDLTAEELAGAAKTALELMSPGAFSDGQATVVLEPAVAASIVDAATRALLTSAAVRRPEVARRLAIGANVASPLLTLVDDPSADAAYGAFHFDDEGEPAAPITLLDRGQVVGRLADRAGVAAGVATVAGRGLRAGHLGRVEPAASHLRVQPGSADAGALLDDGYLLEGALGAVVDPASDRIVVAVARGREVRGGVPTGRVFADLELVGPLGALLASVSGASQQTRTIGLRDERDGRPRWRSIETPWLRVHGMLRARRSAV